MYLLFLFPLQLCFQWVVMTWCYPEMANVWHTQANIRHLVCAKSKWFIAWPKIQNTKNYKHNLFLWLVHSQEFVWRRKKGEAISWSDSMYCTIKVASYKMFAFIVSPRSHMPSVLIRLSLWYEKVIDKINLLLYIFIMSWIYVSYHPWVHFGSFSWKTT